MKNILWILIILFFSGCTQKSVPLPKDGSALLVVPQEGILKYGKKGFAFFYTFTVEDSQGEEHFFKIDGHLSPFGHSVVAKEISKVLYE